MAESRSRGVQRRLNIAPLRINYNDENDCGISNMIDSPIKQEMSSQSSLAAAEELSFYSGNSPQSSPRPCSISPCMEGGLLSPETSPSKFIVKNSINRDLIIKRQKSLDENDGNSMDSGYGVSFGGTSSTNSANLLQPIGVNANNVLQKQRSGDASPRKQIQISPKSSNNFRIFHSLSNGSMESIDDEYMELFELESLDDNSQLPSNINNLISGDIKNNRTTPENKNQRPLIRRNLCLSEGEVKTPVMSRVRNQLQFDSVTPEILRPLVENLTPFSSRIDGRCFKRPEPPTDNPIQSKRYRCDSVQQQENVSTEVEMDDKENSSSNNNAGDSELIRRPVFRKSISLNETVIMNALARCKFI